MGKIDCPHCGKPLTFQSTKDLPHFPFCCERCKMVDLGLWFDEEHRISEELTDRAGPPDDGNDEGPPEENTTR